MEPFLRVNLLPYNCYLICTDCKSELKPDTTLTLDRYGVGWGVRYPDILVKDTVNGRFDSMAFS